MATYAEKMGAPTNGYTKLTNPLGDLQANPDRYDAYSYGGSLDAYNKAIADYRARADAAAQQERITPDATNYMGDLGLAGQSNAMQGQGLGYYSAMANGTGPNSGIAGYRQGVGNAMAAQQSMAAGARGGAANSAAAARLADQQRAQLALGGTNAIGGLDAQGRMMGYAGMAGAANTMNQSALAGQSLSSQWAQANANALQQQQQQDLAQARFFTEQANQVNQAQGMGMQKGIAVATGQTDYANQLALQEQQRLAAAQSEWLKAGAAATEAGAKGITGAMNDEPSSVTKSADGSFWDANGNYHAGGTYRGH